MALSYTRRMANTMWLALGSLIRGYEISEQEWSDTTSEILGTISAG